MMNTADTAMLQKLTDLGYQHASNLLLESTAQLLPVILLKAPGASFELIALDWQDQDKEPMIAMVGIHILEAKVPFSGYSFLSENWTVRRSDNDKTPFLRPRDDPAANESVTIYASNGQEHIDRTWLLTRDKEGRCIALSEQDMSGWSWESWVTKALDHAMTLRRVKL